MCWIGSDPYMCSLEFITPLCSHFPEFLSLYSLPSTFQIHGNLLFSPLVRKAGFIAALPSTSITTPTCGAKKQKTGKINRVDPPWSHRSPEQREGSPLELQLLRLWLPPATNVNLEMLERWDAEEQKRGRERGDFCTLSIRNYQNNQSWAVVEAVKTDLWSGHCSGGNSVQYRTRLYSKYSIGKWNYSQGAGREGMSG